MQILIEGTGLRGSHACAHERLRCRGIDSRLSSNEVEVFLENFEVRSEMKGIKKFSMTWKSRQRVGLRAVNVEEIT